MEHNHESLVQAISALIQKPELCEKVLEAFTRPQKKRGPKKGSKFGPHKLTPEKAARNRLIRKLRARGYKVGDIAKLSGVSRQQCYIIFNRDPSEEWVA